MWAERASRHERRSVGLVLRGYPWSTTAACWAVLVVAVDLAGRPGHGVTGLLGLVPVLAALDLAPRRVAVVSAVVLVAAGVLAFGVTDNPADRSTLRFLGVLGGCAIAVVAARERQRREQRIQEAAAAAEHERRRRELAELGERRHVATSALAGAIELDEVLEAIFGNAMPLGPDFIGVWLLDRKGSHLRFGGGYGYTPGLPQLTGAMPLEADLPAAIAVRTREPVTYATRAERDARWPSLVGAGNVEAVAVLPLVARGDAFGCLAFGFLQPRAFSVPDLAGLGAVAHECALALDRAHLFEAERKARQTLEFLAQGTQLMVSALEPDEVVRRLVRLAVPRLADWCGVYLLVDGVLRLEALAANGASDERVRSLVGAVAVSLDADLPLVRAYRTGELQFVDDVTGVVSLDAELVGALGLTGAVAVPIQISGETIGAMMLAHADDETHDTEEERFAMVGLAARAGVALGNARRYRRQTEAVELLTEALLPDRLPEVDGVELAARYVPASGGVCGDWYEAELLPGGAVLLGVGDAAGHGLEASSTMAQLRNAARGLAVTGADPVGILTGLAALSRTTGEALFGTAVYATLDPGSGAVRWSTAGHIPPLLASAAGDVGYLDLAPGLPFGVRAERPRPAGTADLREGDLLCFVTDGVVERRGETLDVGLERLAAVVAGHRERGVEDLADVIVEALCRDRDDDCCLLLVRRRATVSPSDRATADRDL